MPSHHVHELLKWFEALPFELIVPMFKKFERPCTAFIRPKGTEKLFEIIGDIETSIQSQRFLQKSFLIFCQIKPPSKKQPSFSTNEVPFLTPLTKELFSADLINCIVEMAHQVKLVENNFSVTAERFYACLVGLPHIHADNHDRFTKLFAGCTEESIQRNGLMAIDHFNNGTIFQIAHDCIKILLFANTDLVDSQPFDSLQRPAFPVISFKHRILNSAAWCQKIRCFFAAPAMVCSMLSSNTMRSKRLVNLVRPSTNGRRSLRTPQKGHITLFRAIRRYTVQSKTGLSRYNRNF